LSEKYLNGIIGEVFDEDHDKSESNQNQCTCMRNYESRSEAKDNTYNIDVWQINQSNLQ
jgi:hypothetical protein